MRGVSLRLDSENMSTRQWGQSAERHPERRMMSSKKKEEPLGKLRNQWRSAQVRLSKHELKSDPRLEMEIYERAREFPAWRGIIGMGFSWVLPQLPDFMEDPDPIGRAILVGIGAIVLAVSLWWLFRDAGLWVRWWGAKKDLESGKYGSRRLSKVMGILGEGSLAPVPKDSEVWIKTGEWASINRQLKNVWDKWNASSTPVRFHDLRVLEDAIIALSRLRGERERSKE